MPSEAPTELETVAREILARMKAMVAERLNLMSPPGGSAAHVASKADIALEDASMATALGDAIVAEFARLTVRVARLHRAIFATVVLDDPETARHPVRNRDLFGLTAAERRELQNRLLSHGPPAGGILEVQDLGGLFEITYNRSTQLGENVIAAGRRLIEQIKQERKAAP